MSEFTPSPANPEQSPSEPINPDMGEIAIKQGIPLDGLGNFVGSAEIFPVQQPRQSGQPTRVSHADSEPTIHDASYIRRPRSRSTYAKKQPRQPSGEPEVRTETDGISRSRAEFLEDIRKGRI
ncbi:TPA: hypothetical protein EYO12_02290 [Candidatus Saccharibacteria bacterium]|nr:hypothetical protein [Candidatus Saccharibacteria bacterium]HIO87668.1 hypothetical protein [Candidatus Saccharibacteria bacterium]